MKDLKKSHWVRLKIHGVWTAWIKLSDTTYDQTEIYARKTIHRLLARWEIRAEYQISSIVPLEE